MKEALPCACVRWSTLLALLLALTGVRESFAAPAASPAPVVIAKTSAATKSTAKKKSLRQFTGVVTAIEKTSLTVEKSGKQARTMTFVRDESTSTQGDLEKNARVTVYYRDRDGRSVAHKVVVKSGDASASTER